MDKNPVLTTLRTLAQTSPAGVNPPDGLGGPTSNGAQAPHTDDGAFFVSASRVMAAVRGTPKGVPVPFDRSANLRTAVTQTFLAGSGGGSSNSNGTITMKTLSLRLRALNPSVTARAQAHRSMALAALRADTSLKTRVDRYNNHMAKARSLECQGGAA